MKELVKILNKIVFLVSQKPQLDVLNAFVILIKLSKNSNWANGNTALGNY